MAPSIPHSIGEYDRLYGVTETHVYVITEKDDAHVWAWIRECWIRENA